MLIGGKHGRALPLVLGLLAVLTSIPCHQWGAVASEDGDEGEDGDGDSGDGSGSSDSWEDDDLYGFYDDASWDGYSIVPDKCIHLNDVDTVVFEMYQENNNQCAKGSTGKYSTDVRTFVKAYTKQLHEDAEVLGYDYDKPDYLDYLDCTAFAINDDTYLYFKIGCLHTTGNALEMQVFSDQYCTERMDNTNYSPDSDDISYLTKHIKFGSCHSCVSWPQNDDAVQADVDDQFWDEHAYESPLCSAVNYYKESCGRKCKKLARSANAEGAHKGFTRAGRFWLLVFSLVGLFLLFEVVKQRKKMSAQDSLLEEAAIQRAGLQKRQVALMVIGGIVIILLLMIFRVKILTWIFLLGSCFGLLAYLFYLRYRARGKVEVGGFRLYGDDGPSGGQSSDFAPPPRQVEMS
uniref:Uncharacterized protein n=1 Tax=Odontella aurita TaxID=265563 RepID=A0A7S4J7G4_9STRA|mmetsp:Transcript_40707/g.122606  ORF Transcript_40707/g.122606 Transcript_40707/m.122606 type:complete len:404 (+) Transcript_40707:347-1558(+)